jgi:hypothetical protein
MARGHPVVAVWWCYSHGPHHHRDHLHHDRPDDGDHHGLPHPRSARGRESREKAAAVELGDVAEWRPVQSRSPKWRWSPAGSPE